MYAILVLALLALPAQTQQSPAPRSAPIPEQQQALTGALIGQWTGVLEYRDYSEPATSTKRVQLPTWLTIRPATEGVFFDYTYDDGPNKTVFSHNALVLDLAKSLYRVVGTDSVEEEYTISGTESLKEGHGVLVLNGTGKDNDKPADIRETWTIRRNLLSWLEEVRPAGSSEPFMFRHRYTFVRAQVPATNPKP